MKGNKRMGNREVRYFTKGDAMVNEATYFVLTLPLKLETWQKDRLDKRFRVNCSIYNALLREGVKRMNQMRQTKRYRTLLEQLDRERDASARKQIYRELDQMQKQYQLRRFDFSKMATPYRQYFKENTDAPVVQNLADQAWRAVNDVICRRGSQVHFKKEEELTCLQGKTNQTSIRYQDGHLLWKGLCLPVRRNRSEYERQALSQEIRYCRIKRKWIRGRLRYYAQLVLRGTCPVRRRIPIKEGTVGMDIGFQKLVCVGMHEIREYAIPSLEQDAWQKEKRRLKRRMERSRRAMNPKNYDNQGKVIPGCFFWKTSINYRKFKNELREITRKQMLRRETLQRSLMDQCMAMGDVFLAERLDYAKMKKRAAPGEKKAPLGRRVEQTALSAFFETMAWKMEQQGRKLILVNPVTTAAGTMNHQTEKKESLSPGMEIRLIGGCPVDRRAYSAFLLQHVNPDTGTIDFQKCREDFPAFLHLSQQKQNKENSQMAG